MTSEPLQKKDGRAKRALSLCMLGLYGASLLGSCGPIPGSGEGLTEAEVSENRLSGDERLLPPVGTVVDTNALAGLAAGATEGTFSVTPDGAATYRLPLWVPPGRAGMQPELALSYHSRSGMGLAGMGFTLTGTLSRITRCRKTLAQDSAVAQVRFDATDALCLDGARLIHLNPETTQYGASGSVYRTEVDTFARVMLSTSTPNGPPDYFEVRQKDGRIFTYGAVLAGMRVLPTQALPAGVSTANLQAVRYAWALSEVKDRQGNYLRLGYDLLGDQETGYEQRLKNIEYTGSYTDATVAARLRRVEFHYEPGDLDESYVAGFKMRSASRLDHIDMFAPDVPVSQWESGPSTLWRRYTLEYRNDSVSGRSLLKSVQECDGRNACKEKTSFDWELGSEQFLTLNTGIADVAANSDVPDTSSTLHYKARDFWNVHVADVNGDGKDDLLYRFMRFSSTAGYFPAEWRLRLSTGSGFGGYTTVNLPSSQVGDSQDDLSAVDMDMDGKTDIVALNRTDCDNNISGHFQVYRYNGSNFTPAVLDGHETYAVCGTSTATVKPPGLQVADLSGDGLPDLLRSWRPSNASTSVPTEWAWRLNQLGITGSLGFPGYTAIGARSGMDHSGFVADVDGDGAAEVLLRKPNSLPTTQSRSPDGFAGYYTAVGINPDGSRRETETTLTALPWDYEFSGPFHYRDMWMVDVTGDGLPDALTLHKERQPHDGVPRELRLAINNGSGFLPPQTLSIPAGAMPGPSQWGAVGRFVDSGVRLLDYNMDGRQDLLLTDSYNDRGTIRTNLTVLLSTGAGFTSKVLTGLPVGMSTGQGFTSPLGSTTDLEGAGWGQKLTRVGDINGDGLQDIIQVVGNVFTSQLVVHLRQGLKPDLLRRVTDGNGKWASFEHRALGNSPGHFTAGGCTYPQYCGVRGMWAVNAYMTDNGLDGPDAFFHWSILAYEGARTDLRGRGWLGFSRRTVTDQITSKVTTTVYDNTTRTGTLYLHAFLPKQEEVATPLTGRTHTVTSTFTREPRIAPEGRTRFLCPSVTTLSEKDGIFGTVSWKLQSQDCDGYGNATRLFTVVRTDENAVEGTWTERVLEVENHPSTWVLGLTRRETDTSYTPASTRHPGGQQATRATTYQYCPGASCPESNALWRVTQEPEGTADTKLFTTYSRDLTGQVTSIETSDTQGVLPRLEQISYEGLEKIFPTVIINAAGHRTDVAHHPGLGVVALTEDPNGVRVRNAYDGFGRLRMETAPYREGGASGGATVWMEYHREAPGTRITVQRDGSPSLTHRLDRWDREIYTLVQAADGSWSRATMAYDFFGRTLRITQPRYDREAEKATTFTYDNLGRKLKQTNPDGSFREWVHEWRTTTVYDEKRNKTYVNRNPLGQVVHVSELREPSAPWLVTEYLHGPFGVLDSTKDPSGAVTVMEYDVRGRRTKLLEPKLGALITLYDAYSDVREETDAAGVLTRYAHDTLGREVFIRNPDGQTHLFWDTAPQGKGVLAKAENDRNTVATADDVVTTYSYDTLGRFTQESLSLNGATYPVDQSYDGYGRLDKTWYPTGPGGTRLAVQQTYTATGYPESVRDAATSAEYWRVKDRDAAGRLLVEARGGNVLTSWNRYDGQGRLRFIESRKAAGQLVQSLAYSYNADDSLRSRHDNLNQVTESFQYDGVDRLTRWTVQAGCDNTVTNYGYDDLGNLNARRVVRNGTQTEQLYFQYGALTASRHAITGVSTDPAFGTLAETFSYDTGGNQTQANEPATGRFRNITYTAFNLPSTLVTQQGTLTFTYDALQRRTLKQHSNGDSTLYVAGGLYEKRKKAGVESHVFQVMASGKAVAQVTLAASGGATPVTTYLLHDHLGSVETVTNDAGNVLEQRKYQPFGAQGRADDPTLAPASTASDVRLGFTSHEWDDEAGLVNMKGRLYDPRVGRFLTPDPVVKAPYSSQAFNRYSYGFNNPLRYVDLSGFTPTESSSVVGTWHTADGELMEICGSANPGDCGAPSVGTGTGDGVGQGDSTPSAVAGGADQNGSMETGYVESSCKYCVGDGRGLFAMNDQQMDSLQGWLRETKWSYVPFVGLGTTSLNLMLSLMRGDNDELASDVTQVVISLASAKVVGFAFKTAAPIVTSATRSLINRAGLALAPRFPLGGCFVAGTPVLTAEGLRPIEEVLAGDWVWAWNEKTKEPGWHRVTRTFIKPERVVLRVVLEAPDGTREELGVTAEHPFGVAGQGWTEAQDLRAGDEVESATGQLLRVLSVATSAEQQVVFNFEVEFAHTYFVGEFSSWVHNNSVSGLAVKEAVSFTYGELRKAGLHLTDRMSGNQFVKLVKDIQKDGIKDKLINFVKIANENYVVLGNNRLQAARKLGLADELIFKEVQLPFRGFKTEDDVIEAAADFLSGG
ncbi:VCBS repeat-containing protein [Myxococcus sp. CA033]|uniref:FG-GAP-like repeat-containing protein n=1 Tax=Myxococcus sp. CA033 TaxID=2741516 RepID=UPI00157ADA55|nr:FG-GAP-like repeat-containing protein [Myxococcus sp. CA033]NTX33286.1 VCBS repeat-containing protein [Myxococcus sp. CA033]